jgi:hypothetical protein
VPGASADVVAGAAVAAAITSGASTSGSVAAGAASVAASSVAGATTASIAAAGAAAAAAITSGASAEAAAAAGIATGAAAWVENVPGFGERVVKDFGAINKQACIFAELERWKDIVRATYKLVVRGRKEVEVAHGGQVAKLTRAIALLHLCSRTKPDHDHIRKMRLGYPYLTSLVMEAPSGGAGNVNYDTEALEDRGGQRQPQPGDY